MPGRNRTLDRLWTPMLLYAPNEKGCLVREDRSKPMRRKKELMVKRAIETMVTPPSTLIAEVIASSSSAYGLYSAGRTRSAIGMLPRAVWWILMMEARQPGICGEVGSRFSQGGGGSVRGGVSASSTVLMLVVLGPSIAALCRGLRWSNAGVIGGMTAA